MDTPKSYPLKILMLLQQVDRRIAMIKYSAIKEKDSYKVNVDKCYDDLYDVLTGRTSKCKVFDNQISLFIFAASIGHKRKIAKDIIQQSDNAIHCQPISEEQLATLFSIMVSDENLGGDLNYFLDNEYLSKGLRLAEKYAQAGMEVLCDEVFEDRWNGSTLSKEYSDYGADLLRFIYTERNF